MRREGARRSEVGCSPAGRRVRGLVGGKRPRADIGVFCSKGRLRAQGRLWRPTQHSSRWVETGRLPHHSSTPDLNKISCAPEFAMTCFRPQCRVWACHGVDDNEPSFDSPAANRRGLGAWIGFKSATGRSVGRRRRRFGSSRPHRLPVQPFRHHAPVRKGHSPSQERDRRNGPSQMM